MTMFQGVGLLFTLIAIFGVINHRYLKLPDTIGITAVGLLACLAVSGLSFSHPEMVVHAQQLVKNIDFNDIVFHGLLSFLLFAAALHVDIHAMRTYKLPILLLATIGVFISTVIVGGGFYLVTQALNINLSFLWCMVFGALISPTDPIAVMSVLKRAGAPKSLENKISGEALLNDGTAVVAFLTLLGLATGVAEFSAIDIGMNLAREVIGAIVLGLAVGFGASMMLSRVDSYPIEIMITLAVATAGYSLAELVHVSAPLAVVIMGLVIGSHGASKNMTEKTREHLFNFWELTDDLLNLVIFALIGLELIAITLKLDILYAGLAVIPVVLVARFISVAAPLSTLRSFHDVSPHAIKIMTWGGLRGGISIALALSLPMFDGRDLIIGVTYLVVVFSLLVQAPTLGVLVKRLKLKDEAKSPS